MSLQLVSFCSRSSSMQGQENAEASFPFFFFLLSCRSDVVLTQNECHILYVWNRLFSASNFYFVATRGLTQITSFWFLNVCHAVVIVVHVNHFTRVNDLDVLYIFVKLLLTMYSVHHRHSIAAGFIEGTLTMKPSPSCYLRRENCDQNILYRLFYFSPHA